LIQLAAPIVLLEIVLMRLFSRNPSGQKCGPVSCLPRLPRLPLPDVLAKVRPRRGFSTRLGLGCRLSIMGHRKADSPNQTKDASPAAIDITQIAEPHPETTDISGLRRDALCVHFWMEPSGPDQDHSDCLQSPAKTVWAETPMIQNLEDWEESQQSWSWDGLENQHLSDNSGFGSSLCYSSTLLASPSPSSFISSLPKSICEREAWWSTPDDSNHAMTAQAGPQYFDIADGDDVEAEDEYFPAVLIPEATIDSAGVDSEAEDEYFPAFLIPEATIDSAGVDSVDADERYFSEHTCANDMVDPLAGEMLSSNRFDWGDISLDMSLVAQQDKNHEVQEGSSEVRNLESLQRRGTDQEEELRKATIHVLENVLSIPDETTNTSSLCSFVSRDLPAAPMMLSAMELPAPPLEDSAGPTIFGQEHSDNIEQGWLLHQDLGSQAQSRMDEEEQGLQKPDAPNVKDTLHDPETDTETASTEMCMSSTISSKSSHGIENAPTESWLDHTFSLQAEAASTSALGVLPPAPVVMGDEEVKQVRANAPHGLPSSRVAPIPPTDGPQKEKHELKQGKQLDCDGDLLQPRQIEEEEEDKNEELREVTTHVLEDDLCTAGRWLKAANLLADHQRPAREEALEIHWKAGAHAPTMPTAHELGKQEFPTPDMSLAPCETLTMFNEFEQDTAITKAEAMLEECLSPSALAALPFSMARSPGTQSTSPNVELEVISAQDLQSASLIASSPTSHQGSYASTLRRVAVVTQPMPPRLPSRSSASPAKVLLP